MDSMAWTLAGVALAATAVLVMMAPRLAQSHRRRQFEGRATSGGLGAGLDAVWRPSAEDAHAEWNARIELPAPAPAAGDEGLLADGRIVIDLSDDAS